MHCDLCAIGLSRRVEWIQGEVVHLRLPVSDLVLIYNTNQVSTSEQLVD